MFYFRDIKRFNFSSSEGGIMSPTMHMDHMEPKSPLHSPEEATSLTASVLAKCNANLKKINEPRSHIKLLDSIPSIVTPVDSPITTLTTSVQEDEDNVSTVSFFFL